MWGTIKAVLKRKFIAPNVYLKKFEKSHTNNLTVHWKALEQKEVFLASRSRLQEIFKLRAYSINKIETESNTKNQGNKAGSLRKSTR